jgi:Ni/Co efflux regulator RcnB
MVSKVALGLAQWIVLIYHQKDLSRPSRRSTWCTIGLHRLLALREFEEQGPTSSHHETRSAESIQDSGPQYRRRVFSHPSRGDTWQQVEPS